MSELVSTLMSQFGGQVIDSMSSKVGANKSQTQAALGAVLPILMNGLAKNASNPDGLNSLKNALSKDHDGSILDNLSGFLSHPQASKGESMLNHILGQKSGNVQKYISDDSGLDASQVSSIMQMAAPLLLGFLGKQNKTSDSDQLGGLLSSLTGSISQQQPQTQSIISQLLDSDNDGSIVDDVAELGVSFLGKFFK